MTFIFYFFLIIGITFFITFSQLSLTDIVKSQLVTKDSEQFFINSNKSLSKIDIEYPLFWNKNIDNEENMLSIISPLKNVGVIIKYIPHTDKTVDEFTMNMINHINKNLQNSRLQQIEEKNLSKDDKIQSIILKYGNNSTFYKVSQIWKHDQNHLFLFTYFAPENLFDRFNSTAMEIYNSFRILSNEQPQYNDLNSTVLSNTTFNNSSKNNVTSDNISQDKTSRAISLGNLITYHNKSSGIKIQYPSSFEEIEKNNKITFNHPQEKISISLGILPSLNNTVEEFNEERINFLGLNLNNFEVLNFSQSLIFGYPTNMLLYKYTDLFGNERFEAMELWKMEGNKIFLFSMYSREDLFSELLPITSDIIESIRWNEYN